MLSIVLGASGAACSAGANPAPPSRHDISDFLAAHGKAVMAGDAKTFAAGLSAGPFRTRQQAVLINLGKLPLTTWSYSIGPTVDAADAQRAARKKYGATAVIVRVELRYALRGIDPAPTSHDLWWTFVRRSGRVQAIADDDLATAGGISWQGPWDFGPIAVVRGSSALVIGHPDNLDLLRAVASTIDVATPTVTSVWGTAWPRQVAAVVPSSPDELTAALGPASGLTTAVAAIATSDSVDNLSGTVLGQRLVVEAAPLRRLSDTGRRIVIQHEITHIASAAQTTDATPRWLVEGLAEYVGNLDSGQSVPTAAVELARDVRGGKVPSGLPADAAFDASGAAQAYQSSWLACRLIADRVGAAGLVRFYRAVGASSEASDAAVSGALRSVLKQTPAQFVAQWRAYIVGQLR